MRRVVDVDYSSSLARIAVGRVWGKHQQVNKAGATGCESRSLPAPLSPNADEGSEEMERTRRRRRHLLWRGKSVSLYGQAVKVQPILSLQTYE